VAKKIPPDEKIFPAWNHDYQAVFKKVTPPASKMLTRRAFSRWGKFFPERLSNRALFFFIPSPKCPSRRLFASRRRKEGWLAQNLLTNRWKWARGKEVRKKKNRKNLFLFPRNT
jgi:hypothetical protein